MRDGWAARDSVEGEVRGVEAVEGTSSRESRGTIVWRKKLIGTTLAHSVTVTTLQTKNVCPRRLWEALGH